MNHQGGTGSWVGGSDPATSLCSAFLLVGNLVDGLCTLVLLQLGLAREVNPLLAWVYALSPVSFMVTKLALVQSGMLMLWLHRRVRAAQVGLQVGAFTYAGILAYHIAFALVLPA